MTSKVEELSATLEAVKHQYQEECAQLISDHDTTVTDLTDKLASLQVQLDRAVSTHTTEIRQKSSELEHNQRSHQSTVDSLQAELAAVRHQTTSARETMANSSSSLVEDQFHTIQSLQTDLADNKRLTTYIQSELERVKQNRDSTIQSGDSNKSEPLRHNNNNKQCFYIAP